MHLSAIQWEMITWPKFSWSKLSFFSWSKVLINILSLDRITWPNHLTESLDQISWSKLLLMSFWVILKFRSTDQFLGVWPKNLINWFGQVKFGQLTPCPIQYHIFPIKYLEGIKLTKSRRKNEDSMDLILNSKIWRAKKKRQF